MTATLAVVILQYGAWRNTIACLQSLAPAVAAGLARVIVVDNASPDDSARQVELWMTGAHAAMPRPVHDVVAAHWWPLAGVPGASWELLRGDAGPAPHGAPWTFVRAEANRGFATGMNRGIRVALTDPRVDAVWLLNNDTVVHPDTVAAIRAAVDTSDAETAQFGTTVCYYDRPDIMQSIGWCRWNPWLATSERLHDGMRLSQTFPRVARHPGYVYGASWVLRATALRALGLLSEEGFLYGEELDWSCRAAAAGWRTGLIDAAMVWHHEGATIGATAATPSARTELADLCGISARLRISRRFFPRHLPTVYSSLFGAALNRLRRGDVRRAAAVARLVLAGGVPAPWPTTAIVPSSTFTP